jgi:hypothetical protein
MFSGVFGVLIALVVIALGLLMAIFGKRVKFRSSTGSEASAQTAFRLRWGIAAGLILFGLLLGSNSAVTAATSHTATEKCQINSVNYSRGTSKLRDSSGSKSYWIVSTSCGQLRDDFRPTVTPGRMYVITYVTSRSLVGPNAPRVLDYRLAG